MSATVFCSDPRHHVWPSLKAWCARRGARLVSQPGQMEGGELLVLVSCTHIVPVTVRLRYGRVLVIHESELPLGRGWSPLAWQILEGRRSFTVCLLECDDPPDSGAIWARRTFALEGHELADEINAIRDQVRIELLDLAIGGLHGEPQPQQGDCTRYRRRTPEDSRIDPDLSIAEQFDLMRICDERFPAFFDLRGQRYEIALRKTQRCEITLRMT